MVYVNDMSNEWSWYLLQKANHNKRQGKEILPTLLLHNLANKILDYANPTKRSMSSTWCLLEACRSTSKSKQTGRQTTYATKGRCRQNTPGYLPAAAVSPSPASPPPAGQTKHSRLPTSCSCTPISCISPSSRSAYTCSSSPTEIRARLCHRAIAFIIFLRGPNNLKPLS